jgi:hypothetical protein
MRRQKFAFMMIEVMLYGALLITGVVFVMPFLAHAYRQMNFLRQQRERTTRFTFALDLFRRDVWGACHRKEYWDDVAGQVGVKVACVFRKQTIDGEKRLIIRDVGWGVCDGVLLRTQGVYDFRQHCWKEKSVRVACKNVDVFDVIAFHGQKNSNHQKAVIVSYKLQSCERFGHVGQGMQGKVTIALKNGILV